MNHIAPNPAPLIREIPLSCLALAPENVRKTPPDELAQEQLRASIKAHGLLENLVARADDPDSNGTERFAVVAGGRRLAALKALAEDGALDADHPVPCKIAVNGNAGELSLAENVIRIAMHPADQVVAFSKLAHRTAHRAPHSCPHKCGHSCGRFRRRLRQRASHGSLRLRPHRPPLNRRGGSPSPPSPASIPPRSYRRFGRPDRPGRLWVSHPTQRAAGVRRWRFWRALAGTCGAFGRLVLVGASV